MEILLRTHGPGVHCYLPFRSYANKVTRELLTLQDLCKNSILKCIKLRRLLEKQRHLRLPTYLLHYLTTLTTADFEEIECAPFIDAFSLNFFHRALTYRVFCFLDEQEYMVTHGYCSSEEPCTDIHRRWIKMQHENIMCVCALVLDPLTNNIFYLFDQPNVSMIQICRILMGRNMCFPEVLLWRLVMDLTSALQYLFSRGLRYGKFGLENVFVVKGRVVLENYLTRKCWQSRIVNSNIHKVEFNDSDNPQQEAVNCMRNLIQKVVMVDCDLYYCKSTLDFLKGIDWPNSLDHIIQIGTQALISIGESLTFSELVDTLQNSISEETS